MRTANDAHSTSPARQRSWRARLLSYGCFVLGIVGLAYVLGAAVMFFALPSSGTLTKAFLGARAWNERRQVSARLDAPDSSPEIVVNGINQPEKACDGFTLIACSALERQSCRADLIDMRAKLVHRWEVPFSRVFNHAPPGHEYLDDSLFSFFGCHLYGNGDLLVVFHSKERFAWGYGLAKLDRHSNVLWKYDAPVHHDVDVGEDGTIYAIQQEQADHLPPGLEFLPTPCLVDSLVRLSPEGKPLGSPLPILKALQVSPYAPLLSALEKDERQRGSATDDPQTRQDRAVLERDPVHVNSVQVLTQKLAAHFPRFKAGQVLVSLREADIIAVLDPHEGRVVWAARGAWRRQHDVQFLDNGHLLLFDNHGSPRSARVLEYDPQTEAFPWSYAGEHLVPFHSDVRGMCQRLPNGNTLIVISADHQLLEVTPDKEPVWACNTGAFITTARRYTPDQLPFLMANPRA